MKKYNLITLIIFVLFKTVSFGQVTGAGYKTDNNSDVRNKKTMDLGTNQSKALPYDIAVVGFSQPSAQFSVVGANVIVAVKIRNFGTATVTSFPVSYIYDGGNTAIGTWSGTLNPNDSAYYTFTVPMTVSAGIHSLCSFTTLSNDMNHLNDTTCINYTGVPIFLVPYSDDFEGNNYFYATGTNNSWESGIPASTNINSAHSPTHAWKTNLDGNYISDEASYLYTPFYDFSMVNSSVLDFWHYFNTEPGVDGGRISYSLNGGIVWIPLGILNDIHGINWYNGNTIVGPSWTGNSAGWVHSAFDLSSIPAIINSAWPVQFRFEFFSDGNSTVSDGWAVDDFKLTAPPIPKDAGVTEIIWPNGSTQAGSSIHVKVRIKNFGTDSLQTIPVKYNINGNTVSEIWTGILNAGDTTHYEFTIPYLSPGSAYTLCGFTRRTGDIYWINDTTCQSIGNTPANHDVGVVKILKPVVHEIPSTGNPDTVMVEIKNFGLTTETSIPVIYKINGTTVGTETWTGTLLPGDSTTYQFTTIFYTPIGPYMICSKTVLTNDLIIINDDTCQSYVDIDTYEYSRWNLLQNTPNPANNSTLIGFDIPAPGKVRFEITDLIGNSVYYNEREYASGKNQIEINLQNIPAGIYFYSATYGDMAKTKRMVIVK